MRMWWNGIHSGLKIRRRKLGGSNPPIRTNTGHCLNTQRIPDSVRFMFILYAAVRIG